MTLSTDAILSILILLVGITVGIALIRLDHTLIWLLKHVAPMTPGLWRCWWEVARFIDIGTGKWTYISTYEPIQAWTRNGYETVYVDSEMWDGWVRYV